MLVTQWIATGAISGILLLLGYSQARNPRQVYEAIAFAALAAVMCVAAGTGVMDAVIDYFD